MKKILVADDSPASRELVREALAARGYVVIEACDGRDALRKMEEAEPDLVLLDIQMPAPDGFALMSHIREDARLSKLRVVALTAFAMHGDREKALAAGFDGYITKPVDVVALRSQVKQLLSK